MFAFPQPPALLFLFSNKNEMRSDDVFLPVSDCAVCSTVQKSSSNVVVDWQHYDFLQYDLSTITHVLENAGFYLIRVRLFINDGILASFSDILHFSTQFP